MSASSTQSSAELAVERSQLERVSSELRAAEPAVRHEVAASRVAWPAIAKGLPAIVSPALLAATSAASARASSAQLPEPAFLARARTLTGPAAGVAGIYESYEQLARRGWLLTSTAIATIARAPTATSTGTAGTDATSASATVSGATASARQAQASFARANSPLYIDAVYDGHFDLSLLGKSLMTGYKKLGGSSAFGAGLTPGEVSALAAAYSIPEVRLAPHPGKALERG